ncbi:MAG: hypothetical protein ABH874_05690 [Methanobacteriota archaeon]
MRIRGKIIFTVFIFFVFISFSIFVYAAYVSVPEPLHTYEVTDPTSGVVLGSFTSTKPLSPEESWERTRELGLRGTIYERQTTKIGDISRTITTRIMNPSSSGGGGGGGGGGSIIVTDPCAGISCSAGYACFVGVCRQFISVEPTQVYSSPGKEESFTLTVINQYDTSKQILLKQPEFYDDTQGNMVRKTEWDAGAMGCWKKGTDTDLLGQYDTFSALPISIKMLRLK